MYLTPITKNPRLLTENIFTFYFEKAKKTPPKTQHRDVIAVTKLFVTHLFRILFSLVLSFRRGLRRGPNLAWSK